MIELAGLTRLGQGRAAEVFALDTARVLKIARDPDDTSLDREAAALHAAHAAGLPVPAVHDLTTVDRRPALVMDRVRGADMLTDFARRPWTLLTAGARLGRLHARVHTAPATATLPSAKDAITARITDSMELPSSARDRVLATLAALPDGDRLCHFDFHPGNVIVDGKVLTVIDWPGACRGHALADVAATLVALRGGKTTPGTPLVTRLFAPIGRKLLLGGYRRGYGPVDRELLDRWLVVLSGVRLTYAIAGERETLLRAIGATR